MLPLRNIDWLGLSELSNHLKTSILSRDAPDIRPDKPVFFYIRYPAGYQIALPDIR
jgi:hypothetical protein